jgi:hypothetical protein
MAIEKQKYISKFDPSRIGKAKAHLYYIAHRVGRNGEKMERQLFNNTGNKDEEFVIRLIENSRGMNIFKPILNFDPKLEDTFKDLDLRSITHHVMLKIKEIVGKDFEWVAVMHNDHGRLRFDGTPKRHIHSMVFVDGRLEKHHLAMLRQVAHEQAMKQRLQLDLVQQRQQEQFVTFQPISVQRSIAPLPKVYRPVGMAGGRANHFVDIRKKVSHGRIRKPKEITLPCPNGMNHKVVEWEGKNWCKNCEKVLEQNMELSL